MTYSEVEILEYVENNMTEKRRIAFEREMQKDVELKQLVKVVKASVLPYEAAISDLEQDEMPQSIIEFFDDVSRIAQNGHEAKPEPRPRVYSTQLLVVLPLLPVLQCYSF